MRRRLGDRGKVYWTTRSPGSRIDGDSESATVLRTWHGDDIERVLGAPAKGTA